MRFSQAVDRYIADMFADGRFTSSKTEQGYRWTLGVHADDVSNRDPRTTNREDVKRTLARWSHPNTRSLHRSHLVAFYDWALEEGIRKDNPARQTRKPRARKPTIYRLNRDEVMALRKAARGTRERRAIDIGLLAGLRAQEICGLQGRHFKRPGWVWVSRDIGKGSRERWVPVLPEFELTFRQIASTVQDDEYVVPKGRRSFVEGKSSTIHDPTLPTSYASLWELVRRVGRRAGIKADIHPHLLRHAFGDFVARHADMRIAQFVLGHARIATTQAYTGQATLDEVAAAMRGFGYSPPQEHASEPVAALYGRFEPEALVQVVKRLWASQGLRDAAREMAT